MYSGDPARRKVSYGRRLLVGIDALACILGLLVGIDALVCILDGVVLSSMCT